MASRRDRGDGVTVPFQGGSAMPRRSLETRLHAGSPGQSHGGRRAARAAGPSSSVVPDWWRPECLDTATPDRNAPLAYDAIQHGEVTASRCPGGRGTRGAPGGWPARAQALPSSAWIRGQGAVWAGRETFARTPHQLPRLDAMRSAFQGLRRSTGRANVSRQADHRAPGGAPAIRPRDWLLRAVASLDRRAALPARLHGDQELLNVMGRNTQRLADGAHGVVGRPPPAILDIREGLWRDARHIREIANAQEPIRAPLS